MITIITNKEKPNTKSQLLKILSPLVKEWFFSKFKDFSLPQKYAVMDIHSRKNILVSAPTGATKTLTGFLSVINELVDSKEKGILEDKIYAIYISPLKALNNDIEKNLKEPLAEMEELAGKKLGIRVAVRTGDTTASEKAKMLKNPPHILITTPESLAIMLSSFKFCEHFHTVDWTIIDEIHALAENKRGVHLSLSMERLQRLSPAMTRVGLSATISPLKEIAKYLVGYKADQKDQSRDCSIVDVQFIKDLDLKVISPAPDLINITHDQMQDKLYELIHKLVQEHKTTVIFTNTRAATERVVDHLKDRFPQDYNENIGAHHGSLSKNSRLKIENALRDGKLKCAVTSTSLELGIDIGYIDLVILLGSPKTVARALQRCGRSGHKLHAKSKGRIIVLSRDDLVENSVLLKSAIEKKIDKIHIPRNALDVLAQQIFGIAIADKIHRDELYTMITSSYSYHHLRKSDFNQVLDYLAGKYVDLEDRYIYSKIWIDEETGMIGKRGRMSRVIYMTNIGTIPDESFVIVKVGTESVGHIDEGFLERLKRGDIFVLGGQKYQFLYAKGMVAQVRSSVLKPPTIPSWFSEMLPLSFDLAMEIGKFRRLMSEKFCLGVQKEEIIKFIHDYLYVDENAAHAIFKYFQEQFEYIGIPHDKRIIVEYYKDEKSTSTIFHTVYGRRVNDCLSRLFAFAIARAKHKDVEIGINDNGFFLRTERKITIKPLVKLLTAKELRKAMEMAIDNSEVLKRRFRHCAGRALMILRNYKGRSKRVGRQQVSSMILINAVRRIDPNFSILREAKREVLEDHMDIDNAEKIIAAIESKKIKIEEMNTNIPSPFAFSIVLEGYTDVYKIDDKIEFLKRMHQMVLAKIGKTKVLE